MKKLLDLHVQRHDFGGSSGAIREQVCKKENKFSGRRRFVASSIRRRLRTKKHRRDPSTQDWEEEEGKSSQRVRIQTYFLSR